jgi:hypothetical protein
VSHPTRFWQAIESLPSLAAVAAEWQSLLGGEYDLIKPFFHPRTGWATSFPNIGASLPYQVVDHGSDDIVGVCHETGETISLAKSQLVVYELDRHRLAERLAEAWGIDCGGGPEDWSGTTTFLGQFTSAAATCYATFLAFPHESEDLHVIAAQLIAEKRAPFILFAPTRQWLRRAAETAMRFHGCKFVSLAEALTVPRRGHFEPVIPLESITAKAMEVARGMKDGRKVETGRNVFRLEGDFWTLTFADKTAPLKDSLGLKCIAHLISKKGYDVHASVLRAVATKNIMVTPSAGIEVLGPEGIERYKARREDLVEQREEAKEFNDVARHEQIQEEIYALDQQIISAQGLGGRIRKTKDQAANARTSLTNAISRAIELIQQKHASLARHLDKSIRTGKFMSYSPETDVDWDL